MNIVVFFLLILLNGHSALLAATVPEKQQELHEVQSQIQQMNVDLETLSNEKSVQQDQLKALEKQYGDLVNAMLSIKLDIKQHEEKLREIRNKIAVTQKDFQVQKHALEGIIKSAYTVGDQEGLKLILNQHDPSLSGRMLVYHDYISKARLQKIQLLQEHAASLRQLEAEKNTAANALEVALEKKQRETDAMLTLKTQREKLLEKVDSDYQSKNLQRARLLHDEKKLAALVASLQKTDDNDQPERSTAEVLEQKTQPQSHNEPQLSINQRKVEKVVKELPVFQPFADLQGQLSWPVQGAVVESFGSRRFETTWDGAVINAREGADIHAIANGRVVYADWLRGYGLMTIVDHGGGYMSLYGFNQSLHKKVGEQISTGETLASVGRSGGRAQAALYFGIRKKGRPVDPELWCRSSSKN